tara:strand:+ start:184 stop:315 length:132 start_codon:yes stop_codon:yes gene_type:complete
MKVIILKELSSNPKNDDLIKPMKLKKVMFPGKFFKKTVFIFDE